MTTKRGSPSVPDEHLPTDKHFAPDGRKLQDLDYVGESSPDTDPDAGQATSPPARSPPEGGRGR